jgi:ATP-binding cassette, subfamily B, bacterial
MTQPTTHSSRPLSTLQQMLRLIRYQGALYAANAFFWTAVHTSPLIPGLIAKAFFDALEAGAAGFNAWTFVALTMGVGLARVGLIFGGILVNVPFRFRMGGLLRRNLVEKLLERPGALRLSVPMGDAISTLRDDADVAVDGVDWSLDILGQVVFVTVALTVLFSIDARTTLLVFLPLAAVLSLAYAWGARLEKLREKSRASTARVTGLIAEMFGATQSIQVAGAESRVINHFRTLGRQRQAAVMRDVVQSQALEAFFGGVVNLGTGFILLLVAGQMRGGAFSVGDFAVFASYLGQVAWVTQFFGRFMNTYRQTGVSFKRMGELLEDPSGAYLATPRDLPLKGNEAIPESTLRRVKLERLEVRHLTYRHDSGRGIENVSFSIPRGSFTVITGRIGSGKTTLLRSVLGLLHPQSGEVLWNSEPVTHLEPPLVAYTAQVPTLLSDTLRENILLHEPMEEARLERAVRNAVLDTDLPHLERGLETLIGTKGVKLSGGQMSRAAAARMFYREAELLVFDDLSSALDVNTEAQLWERVFALNATALVVSHRKAALTKADQIVLLEDGQVTAVGTLEHLLAHHAEMKRLWSGESDH